MEFDENDRENGMIVVHFGEHLHKPDKRNNKT